jgi:putative tricarboxylic transport membrane protein
VLHKDCIAGLLLLALAGAYYKATLNIPSSSLSDEVGADGLPKLLAISLAIIAITLVIKGFFAKRAETRATKVPEPSEEDNDHAGILRALGFVVIGIGYMFVAPLVGFALGIAALIIAVAIYEKEPLSLKLVAVALTAGASFWLLFVRLLGAEQPVSSILASFMKI